MAPDDGLSHILAANALSAEFPDGTTYTYIAEDTLKEIAKQSGRSLREVQIEALSREIVPQRYVRNFRRFSMAEQKQFLETTVLLVGLGGLGGSVLESLLRAGIGQIIGADGDVFEESNLNRQALSAMRYMDKPKAQAAADRRNEVNPAVELTVVPDFLDAERMLAYARQCDIVVDALGGLRERLNLQRAAAEAGKPLVTAAVAGFTGWVGTVLPGEIGPFDFLPPESHESDAQNGLGCPAPTVAVAAAMQAAEVMQLVAGKKPALAGKMLLFDLTDMSFDTITLGT